MRSRRWARRWEWAAAALLAAALWPAAGHAANDAWITAKTKMALLTGDGVSATEVDVDTVDGRVTLHGTVDSEREKTRAAEIARGIEGTREVRNLLQVVPPGAEERAEAEDDQIRERVTRALAETPQLDGSDVEVESVNAGVVLLSGKAESFEDHLAAVAAAAEVPGVKRVASEIQSPDAMADAEIRREGERADGPPDAPRSATRAASDAWITSQTKVRLLADPETPALDVNVDTERGVVTLFGVVGSEQEKSAAEANARKVDGVKQVRNQLQIVRQSRREAVEAKDDELERAVQAALEKRALRDSDIDVEVRNGVVRLSGNVPSESDRVTAAVAARSTPGVRSVLSDDLRIEAEG